MKRGLSEHAIQSQILDWLKAKGIFHWRNNVGGAVRNYKGKARFTRFGIKGSPDIFVLHKTVSSQLFARIIGIEVKAPGEKQSMAQADYQIQFSRAGGVYLLVYSLEDVLQVLAG